MPDEAIDDAGAPIEVALKAAATVVDEWGATSDDYTGRWLDPRNALIGVGIVDHGDDEAVRELLQGIVPVGVRVRVRLVSAPWIRLHQLQVHVTDYLDDHGLWGQYAVAIGVDQFEHHVEVGLLPTTPDSVAAQIIEQFPADVALNRSARIAIAL